MTKIGKTTKRERLLATTLLAGVAAFATPAAIAVVGSAFVSSAAVAQDYTSGILSGTVEDETGAAVAGASVTVTSAQGGVRSATTGADGTFRVPALAVGSYTVKIEKAGYSAHDQKVSVAPSSNSAYTFTMLSEGATVDEVVVTASRVSDFSRNDTGLSVDVQDLAEKVPVGRSISSVAMLTPGATQPDASINASSRRNQSMVGLSGTSAAESVTYINGLNVTDQRTFLGYADLPFDMIQTIDVKTGGYQAEFGRGTGGVVNIVTRSGSNEFEAGASAYWTPSSLRSSRGKAWAAGGNNNVGQEVFNQFSDAQSSEQSVWASGPILKDRLFFFGVYNARESEAWGAASFSNPTTGTGTQTYSRYNDPRWALKLDFVINPNHRIEATLLNDKTTTDVKQYSFARSSMSRTTELQPYYQEAGGLNQIFKYTGVFTDWFTLSALYGKVENNFLDYGPYIALPGVTDDGAYVTNGRQAGPFNLAGRDDRTTYRVDADFYFDLMGDHHVRVGYDREDLTSSANSAYTGGGLYNAYSDPLDCPAGATADGCVEIITFANKGVFGAKQSAWYVQDSWQITPDLSLQLGLRSDIYDYKNVDGKSYISIDGQFAPRLGFNWDPFGKGQDRVFGSVGDYYLPIATNTSIRASSGEIYTDAYYTTARDGGGNLIINPAGYPTVGSLLSLDYLSPPGAPDPKSVIEADLDPMYEREFVLGYEHRFEEGMFADWTMGVTYINRELKSAIEDTAIGDAIYRYCTRTGIMATCNPGALSPSDFSGIFPYVLVNPGDGAKVFIDLQGDTRTLSNGAPNPAYNPQSINLTAADMALPKAERTYQALQFTFERPFDGTWMLKGSYTLAHSEGNYEGAIKSDIGQTDTSLTQDFDHAANTRGSFGDLPNDRRHAFKLFGSYSPIEKLSIGGNFTAVSGRPIGCYGFTPQSIDPLAPNSGTPSTWMCPRGTATATAVTGTLATQLAAAGVPAAERVLYNSVATPRGSMGETDWTYQLDLNLAYKVMEDEQYGDLTATVDIFNVFDGDAVQRVVEQGEVRTSASGQKGIKAPFYGMPRTYQAPRTVRFGLRYKF